MAEFKPKVWMACPLCGKQSPMPDPDVREWVGLCDTDIGDEYVRFEIQGGFNRFEYAVRAIEAKLKEKNT